MVRTMVEVQRARWFILSALHGLVAPTTEIQPYEQTLNEMDVRQRRMWADRVLEQLLPEIEEVRRVVIFAGQRYREFLTAPLQARGVTVEVPMAHLRQGEQLAWLTRSS